MIVGDFETRSGVELKDLGTYEYARHPSTEVLSYAWAVDDSVPALWHPAFRDFTDPYAKRKADRTRADIQATPEPKSLFKAVEEGHHHEAHNAFFERCIWKFVMVDRHGWPEIPDDHWVCTAALAASYALRAKLDHVTRDLGLSQHKDSAGHKTMMKHTKPRNLLKWERRVIAEDNGIEFDGWEWESKTTTAFKFESQGLLVSDDFPRFLQLRKGLLDVFAYNLQDVEAERSIGKALRPLPKTERVVYNLDQKINFRGLHCDRNLVEAAIKIGDACDLDSQEELSEITDGDVCKVTQRDQMKKWLNEQGVSVPTKLNPKGEEIETTEADAMEEILVRPDVPEHVARACSIWLAVNKTSTKKYRTIRNRLGTDDRVRESMRYHAASTGRWGGKGIQPHNYPRKCPKDVKGDAPGDAMERTCQHVSTGDYELVSMIYGRDNIMQLLSSVLRGTITPAPGNELLASDYSAIEARGTFWVTGHSEGIKAFDLIDSGAMPGQDIYTWQASEIHGRTIYKTDDQERQDGKVVILGCGYQMGGPKLASYAGGMGVELSEERATELVNAYREKNWPVKDFWYKANEAAIRAVRNKGTTIRQEHIAWKVVGRFLHCRLPSGRLLSYLDPKVEVVDTPWGKRPQLQFWGVDTYTRQWIRTSTYGGKLTENIVQALCRDIMAEAMVRAENAGYHIVLTVHDEIVSEVPKGFGSVEEFNAILSERPKWADNFPIVAEGWRAVRYRK